MNLSVLQRQDPTVEAILATAAHVALYSFQHQAWQRKDVEGSLFIVERSCFPHYQLVVLNRLSTENFCENLSPQLQMKANEPYLLFRNADNEITGIWFYNKEEQQKIGALIKSIIEGKISYEKQSPSSAEGPIVLEPADDPEQSATMHLKAKQSHVNTLDSPWRESQTHPVGLSHPTSLSNTSRASVTRDDLKRALLSLVQDDNFVNMVYEHYLANSKE
jgi:hypothetical protein